MTISVHRDGHTVKIRISGEMTVYNASEIKKGLAEHLFSAKEIELDLSGVSEIDSAGLQLMILAKSESMGAGRSLRITALSGPVEGIVRLYNMQEFFRL